jgi:hypothetical protein
MITDRLRTGKPPTEGETAMEQTEPPSGRSAVLPRLFHIGRDSHGNWVAQDQQGLCGGLFVDRAQALKFARFENGNCKESVIIVPGVIELDLSSKRRTRPSSPQQQHKPQQRGGLSANPHSRAGFR